MTDIGDDLVPLRKGPRRPGDARRRPFIETLAKDRSPFGHTSTPAHHLNDGQIASSIIICPPNRLSGKIDAKSSTSRPQRCDLWTNSTRSGLDLSLTNWTQQAQSSPIQTRHTESAKSFVCIATEYQPLYICDSGIASNAPISSVSDIITLRSIAFCVLQR
ncbi:unnamed protein product [Nezara viridula]|uniref:Uncharacterized protein n=1 Tax=Nezara viridula TaxID=85310 RepID=A0A9P0MM56_NEZVI|nr:unnamed protein product [Nezara viridula]